MTTPTVPQQMGQMPVGGADTGVAQAPQGDDSAALALGGLVTAAGNLLCAYAPDYPTFVGARFVAGVGAAFVLSWAAEAAQVGVGDSVLADGWAGVLIGV